MGKEQRRMEQSSKGVNEQSLYNDITGFHDVEF